MQEPSQLDAARITNPLLRWLRSARVSDPVDRRNAPFLQMLLLFFGLFVPVNKALFLHAMVSGQVPRPDTVVLVSDLITDVLLVSSSWVALWLIRTGRFRRGVALFLSVASVCVGIAYAGIGLTRIGLDPIPLVLLSLAGLVMGRPALWRVLAALTAMLLVCMALSIVGADAIKPALAIGKTVSIAGVWFIVALVLDRTVAALRDSLEASEQRGRALEQACARLEEETAERERTREQLIHSQKLDVAGRLASGLAHDFGNVLTVILGYAQRRQRLAATGGEPALISALEGVELAARRALAISRKLLSFSRLDVAQAEIFDAGASLQDLQPMLRQMLGSEIRLRLDLPQVALQIHMDRSRFELMILNIASNAKDALGDEGTFRIDAAPADAGRTVVLTLSDDGPGMPESVRARAFEHFFTTKPKDVGTGLGLPVVRDIVLEAGGEIRIECPPEGGTSVYIVLPVASNAMLLDEGGRD